MAKTNKKFRAMAFIVAFAMVACLAPTVAFAENTVTMEDLSFDESSGTPQITAAGTIASGAELTMMAVRTETAITDLSGFATDADLEKAIMYIDQVTSDGAEKSWTFGLRDSGATGRYITVFMGGTDAAMQSKSYAMLAAPGSVELSTPGDERDYFVAGYDEMKLTYTDSTPAGWTAAVETAIVDAEGNAAGSVDGSGNISLDEAPETITTYKATFTADGYNVVADKTFKAISAVAAAKATLPASLTVDKTTDPSNWAITVPDKTSEYGVAITYAVKVGEGTEEVKDAGASFTVPVPAEDAETLVVVTAKLNDTEATKEYSITVSSKAPAIAAENIEFIGTNVYDRTGKSVIVITVDNTVVDPETSSIEINGEKLFYSPVKAKFYGITATTTPADLVAASGAVNINTSEASEKLYFGVVLSSNNTTGPKMADAGAIARIAIKADKASEADEKALLAGDVANGTMDGKIAMADAGALARVAIKADAGLAINN